MAVRKAKFFVGGGLFLAALAGLLITGFEEGKAYYQTVGELQAMGPRAEGRRVRVAGDVVPGTIASEGEGRVRFQIEHEGSRLAVLYTGREPLPDTLVDRAQAVAEGHLLADGSFEANHVQAKCASKYDAAYEETKTDAAPATPAGRQATDGP